MMENKKFNNLVLKIFTGSAFLSFFANPIFTQQPGSLPPPQEDYSWWYLTLIILSLCLAGAIVWKVKSRKQETVDQEREIQAEKKRKNNEGLSFDADAEMEWLRKNQKIVDRKRKKPSKPINLPKTNRVLNSNVIDADVLNGENVGFADLLNLPKPVFGFKKIKRSAPFSPLTLSNDEALINAIEQTHDEYEEDEEVRDLALRILAAFKNRNAVEALSQIAIYDLSSALRSKAIGVLTEFDHESVFETILLGCADPTREVRAAAARGLTRLSFDRADAWTRLIETNESGRMGQAARAAIEGGFVERSFDRLIHRDSKHAYEAFVLLSLIVKSGETEKIFEALKNNQDRSVRAAILHVIKVSRDHSALSTLYGLLEDKKIAQDLKDEIDRVISEMGLVTV